MERTRYVELTRRQEADAARHPRLYRARAVLLALAGYGFLFGVMFLTTLAVTALLRVVTGNHLFDGWIAKVLLALASILLTLFQLPRETRDAPEGLRLAPADAPRLFEEVERLRRALRAPRVDEIWLTGDMNASLVQHPRPLRRSRNALSVGYPLLATTTLGEARAVLAHELAHLSRSHSRINGWIHRVRRTWARLVRALEQDDPTQLSLFRWFARWYGPYFEAYSLVLARRHEIEADRLAGAAVGAPLMAQALASLEVRTRVLVDDYWTPLWRAADEGGAPPDDAITRLRERAAAGVEPARATAWLDEVLRIPTDPMDTHPALAERLMALTGMEAADAVVDRLIPSVASDRRGDAGATALLADARAMTLRLDEHWLRTAAAGWAQRAEEVELAKATLAALDGASENDADASPAKLWARACALRDLHGDDAALPVVERVLALEPEHAAARFALGNALLQRGDAKGVPHVEFAMERDHSAVLPGCQIVHDYLVRAGRAEEAERWVARGWEQQRRYADAAAERSHLRVRDRFVPHALDADTVAAIVAQLAGRKHLRRAYLVQRVVEHFPEDRAHVLVLESRLRWWWMVPGIFEARICAGLLDGLELPYGVRAFAPLPEQASTFALVRKVPGAEVWSRP